MSDRTDWFAEVDAHTTVAEVAERLGLLHVGQSRTQPTQALHFMLDDARAVAPVGCDDARVAEQVSSEVDGYAARAANREIVRGESGESGLVGGVGGRDAVGHSHGVSQ